MVRPEVAAPAHCHCFQTKLATVGGIDHCPITVFYTTDTRFFCSLFSTTNFYRLPVFKTTKHQLYVLIQVFSMVFLGFFLGEVPVDKHHSESQDQEPFVRSSREETKLPCRKSSTTEARSWSGVFFFCLRLLSYLLKYTKGNETFLRA